MEYKNIAIVLVLSLIVIYLKAKASTITAIPKISTSERNGIVNPTLGELVYDKDEDTMFMWNANMGWIMAGSAISFTNFVDANKNTSLYKINQNGLFTATYAGDNIMFYSTDIGQQRTTSQIYAVNSSKGKLILDTINNTITANYNGLADDFTVVKLAMSY